ncbi:PCI-domain-containing protein [Polychaeton citri CBS 116435]|uniref:Eukaryotic translation initiation factor 3 subunit M n=1 Tax=Polychaeton citri CBS 116435 TaxID=1314669 RepID=A0A9P4QH23_9PEZI|nr:PCI-domain-containing protein [Polychaeton citri CBS 116435]
MGLPNLSLVEGAFEELVQELAVYLDSLRGEGSTVASEIAPLIAKSEGEEGPKEADRDGVLKKIVTAASALNKAPERELQAAYNLLIHLITYASDPDIFIARVCQYLSQPVTSSAHNSTGLVLGILASLFNAVEPDDETRFNILLAINSTISNSGNYETLRPQLKNLDGWIAEWELEPDNQRKLFLTISESAAAADETADTYTYLLKALRTTQSSPSTDEARELGLRALKLALLNEKHFDFQDLTSLDSIQALRKSDPVWLELLELFSAENFDDFQDFKEANGSFLSDEGLDEDVLDRKSRLLTLASLAAQASQTRQLPYSSIAKALQVPSEDVEMWVIDSVRSGLVEGKLSQQKQEFLIHRSTYRVFGDHQWREVASRLENWRSSLTNVLAIIRQQKEEFIKDKEAELNPPAQNSSGYRPNRRDRNQPQQQQAVAVE